jgi:hypothetical protein
MSGLTNDTGSQAPKPSRLQMFGLGKKKDSATATASPAPVDKPSLSKDSSKLSATSPILHEQPSSPTRGFSTSPRLSSPAGSQIFERDVQDPIVLAPTSNSAIPTHIQTENYIPSVLDDASEAITNEKLDPDTVEIVTHSYHQPAAVTMAAGGSLSNSTYDHSASDWVDELNSMAENGPHSGDNASNYGSLDSADVRRLSFISFADVVQAEHGGALGVTGSRDSVHLAGLTSLNSMNRSPSPIWSPVSSQGGPGTSPPTSNPGSIKGFELSPSRKPIGSPTSGHLSNGAMGDLNIETMTQALRRTGSGDLGQGRSIPQSPTEGIASR